ncbi:MAG: undecaprenyl-diphosphate phosphatase [Treponemataceae bacterium]
MTIFEAVLLGALQGIAEFLPISSSGHLLLAQKILHIQEQPLLFSVFLHLATLLAVVIFFHKIIRDLILAFWRIIRRKTQQGDDEKLKIILALLIATAITAGIGLSLSKFIPLIPPKIVSIGFIVTALILILADTANRRSNKQSASHEKIKTLTIAKSLIIGIAQGLAVLPGISRSGITISTAIFCNIDRKTAGEFSFLLSIPAILGAFILEARHLTSETFNIPVATLIIGCLVAFISGLLSLFIFIRLIKKGNFAWFSLYLIPLGIVGLLFL